MSGSLRGRLGRALGITAAVSVAATALISFGLVRRLAEQSALQGLTRRADAAARESDVLSAGQVQALRRLLLSNGDQIAFIGPRGAIRTDDPAAREVASSVDLGRVLAGDRTQGRVSTSQGTFVYVALPVLRPGGLDSAVVLTRSAALARDVWRPIVLRLLFAALIAVALAVAASALLARRLTDPLIHMSAATERVAAGDLSKRVPVEGDDEIARLARRFNAMADSLAEAKRREHEFLGSVSHELRTPITAIRGYAEAIADGAAKDLPEALSVIQDEATRLERLVQDVMDLARLGAKEFRLEPLRSDLAATVSEAVRAHSARASEAGVTLGSDLQGELIATTDAGRVRQVLSNLIENALRVTPEGGSVVVRGRAELGQVVLEVHDTGPGIASSDLQHVFERSYLWARSRGIRQVGTGLGLAIVRELVSALGGTIEAESEPAAGTTFRFAIPI